MYNASNAQIAVFSYKLRYIVGFGLVEMARPRLGRGKCLFSRLIIHLNMLKELMTADLCFTSYILHHLICVIRL